MEPRISIIMPTFNQGKYIERAILSVIKQKYINKEFIIIDNLSTDDTEKIIRKYESHIDHYIREQDSGQSNAINKGFKIATGEFLSWLNSDDILLPNTLQKLATAIKKSSTTKWYLGNVIWIDKNDKVLKTRKGEKYNRFLANRLMSYAYGPSAFIHRDLIRNFGSVREDFHYMMDTELWLRYLIKNIKFERLDFYCWGLRLHEEAKMSAHNFKNSELSKKNHPSQKQKKEEKKILDELYYSKFPSTYTRKLYLYFIKLTSIRYLLSFYDQIRMKGKNIHKINLNL